MYTNRRHRFPYRYFQIQVPIQGCAYILSSHHIPTITSLPSLPQHYHRSSTNPHLEALKQLYIIERTPSPSPDIFDGLTAADRREMQAMAERLRVCPLMNTSHHMQSNSCQKRRLEPDPPIKSEHAVLKREGGSKRRRTDPIVIDLTADSDEDDDDDEGGSSVTLH